MIAHELHLPELALLARRVSELLAVEGLSMGLHMGAALRAKLANAVCHNSLVDLTLEGLVGAVQHTLQDLLLFDWCMPSIVNQRLLYGVSALIKCPAGAAFALTIDLSLTPGVLLIHSRIGLPEQICDFLVRFWRNH